MVGRCPGMVQPSATLECPGGDISCEEEPPEHRSAPLSVGPLEPLLVAAQSRLLLGVHRALTEDRERVQPTTRRRVAIAPNARAELTMSAKLAAGEVARASEASLLQLGDDLRPAPASAAVFDLVGGCFYAGSVSAGVGAPIHGDLLPGQRSLLLLDGPILPQGEKRFS